METTKSESVSPRLESLPFWTWIILLGICLAIFIVFSVMLNDNKSNDPENDDGNTSIPQQKNEYEWVVIKSIPINLTDKYTEPVNLTTKQGFSVKNATVPYCIMNGNKIEVCGEKDEKVAKKLPQNDPDNDKLQFKSRDGENGTLELVIMEFRKK